MPLMDLEIDVAEEFETIMIEKSMLDTKTQIQEAQRTLSKITTTSKPTCLSILSSNCRNSKVNKKY